MHDIERVYMEKIERQELYCHECGNYVQFDLDVSINGNHVLTCPECGHEHCRVVKDGEVTDIRWDSRNGDGIIISNSNATISSLSTYNAYASGNSTYATSSNTSLMANSTNSLYASWMNMTNGGAVTNVS